MRGGGSLAAEHLYSQAQEDCRKRGLAGGYKTHQDCTRRQWASILLLGYRSDERDIAVLEEVLEAGDVSAQQHAALSLIGRSRPDLALDRAIELLPADPNFLDLGLAVAPFDDRGVEYVLRGVARGVVVARAEEIASLFLRLRAEARWIPLIRQAVEGKRLHNPESKAPARWLGALMHGVDREWAIGRLRLMAAADENPGVSAEARDILASPAASEGDQE